jgi:predicted kinase
VLDCIEFADALRHGDVLADVAFLAMDLERLGRPDLAAAFLAGYREHAADTWPASLAHHHIAYRAQVRAKVAILRARQGDSRALDETANLLGIAARHLDAGRVKLVLVGGSPGTGKSTLATTLGGRLGAVVLRSDEIRKELAGLPVGAHAPAPLDAGIYEPSWTEATYRALLERTALLLGSGESVVIDASWQHRSWRAAARELSASASADLCELRCTAPLALAVARVGERGAAGDDVSDADAVIATAAAERFPAWPEAVEVETTGTLSESADVAVAAIAAGGPPVS